MRIVLSLVMAFALSSFVVAEDAPKKITLAEGKLELTVPEGWKTIQPSVRIIDHEFSAPAAEGDDTPGRATLMGAGGGVKANIDRWKGQFSNLTTDKTEEIKVNEMKVHIVDLAGTFRDQRGPFAPAEVKEGTRMLGAIIETKAEGDYFIKFYGPEKTITENEKKFLAMVNSATAK
ncbi:MAG: hypothetical protein WDZ51_07475 [Pirellulaceae bacterium]